MACIRTASTENILGLCGKSGHSWEVLALRRVVEVYCRHKYECGMAQTVSHTVNECPLTILSDGGLQRLHLADDDAVNWLEQTVTKAFVK